MLNELRYKYFKYKYIYFNEFTLEYYNRPGL